jgi:N-acetylglucosaminyldiphosphoundecaprenol N-acetyl-beta-D-mannosaminyltransferase
MKPNPDFSRHDLLGLPLEHVDARVAADRIVEWAAAGEGGYVCVSNVHQWVLAHDEPAFAEVLLGARLRLADSMVLQRARTWISGAAPPETLLGSRLTLELCRIASQRGVPIALFGGTAATLDRLRDTLVESAPGIEIAYAHAPPFRSLSVEEEAQIVDDLTASGARLLFVGLGCPKQERWMAAIETRLCNVVMVGVGAAFDTLAGTISASPEWVHQAGLEWAWRLAKEPRRLWRRYFATNPRFLFLLLRQKFARPRAT